jgi:hypothetical protein
MAGIHIHETRSNTFPDVAPTRVIGRLLSVSSLVWPLVMGCSGEDVRRPGTSPATVPLGEGAWEIVYRSQAGTLIVQGSHGGGDAGRDAAAQRPGRGDLPSTATPPILLFRAGEPPQPIAGRTIRLTFPDGADRSESPNVEVVEVDLGAEEAYFGFPGPTPPLTADPSGESGYVFESRNRLWAFSPPAPVRQLTSDTVGRYAFATLASRQREGAVILYWAAAPTWSPDGKTIAYATNREAVANGANGQSVWLVDVESGGERVLIEEAGHSFRPVGWLGGELLVIGDFQGIWAVDPGTAAHRVLSLGTLLAADPHGGLAVVADGLPDSTTVQVLTQNRSLLVSNPPDDLLYTGQAVVSPGGGTILLQAASSDGLRRRFFIFALDGSLRELEIDPTSLDDWPAWLDESTLLINVRGASGHAEAVSVPD